MTTSAGVVTVLFTDVVGSTQLLDRLGDDAAEELRRTHFALLRLAIAETGGREVKSMGDGLMVAFTSPLEALRCAVSMQRAVANHNRQSDLTIEVRIGVHAGEPIPDQGDLHGTAIVVAKRLCDQARGGQILAGQIVADLVGSRGGFGFRSAGRMPLKGLARPLAAVVVDWSPGPSAGAAVPPAVTAPTRVVTPRGPALVGREREMAVLEAELERAVEGEFRIVLVLGEPGVGKTRLGSEVLARHGGDVLSLSARGHPLGETTSFGLWAEAFEGHLRAQDPSEVADLCGGFLDDLSGLLRSAAAARGAAPSSEPSRARLLEGLAVLLRSLARTSPVVLLLDDVHVADASSWDAIHYLARNLSAAPVLLLATARPVELAAQPGANQILLGLEQDGALTRLSLQPLPSDALGELVAGVLERPAPPPLVGWLEERSRGNPLFTLGLLRALLDEGADLAAPRLRRLPEGLAERVTARLSQLDEPQRSVLEVLAVVDAARTSAPSSPSPAVPSTGWGRFSTISSAPAS
jgi:class 3 adenylate cyclase